MIWVIVAGVLVFLFASKCHIRRLEVLSAPVLIRAGFIEILAAYS